MKHLLFVALILMTIACFYVASTTFLKNHVSEFSHTETSYIDMDYSRIRKILIRTDSMPEIVRQQHGELLHQEWDNLNLLSDRLLGPYTIKGTGKFTVKVDDPDMGEIILPFSQDVHIDTTWMKSKAHLMSPVDFLKKYNTTLYLSEAGDGRTKIENTVSLRYSRIIPTNFEEYMDNRVRESAIEGAKKGQEALINVVKKYADNIIIPIRR